MLAAHSDPAAAQGVPRKIEFQAREVISHGVFCTVVTQVTILGKNVLLSNTARFCGPNNRRSTPTDQGWAFPVNGSQTQKFVCKIDAGSSPIKSCTNGDRLKLVGMKFPSAMRLDVTQTLSSKLSGSRLQLIYQANEDQTTYETKGAVTREMKRVWQYEIAFSGGQCEVVSISKRQSTGNRNSGPLSVKPLHCKVLQ